jgi:hypothetical protein
MFGTAYTRPATPAITLGGEFADIINSAQSQQELSECFTPQTSNPNPYTGFEIIIGNPPYVRHEAVKRMIAYKGYPDEMPMKEALEPHFQCFTGTADLYVYFYERALQLLRTGGILSYITSNSFLNSAFGEKLRGYLASHTTLLTLIDFAETKVFTAITEPCILITRKGPSAKNTLRALKWEETLRPEKIAEITATDSFPLSQAVLASPPWQLEPPRIRKILDRLSTASKPLRQVVANRFYYGIKTGLNEAFVVDKATRDSLIAEHPESSEILKPFLRGRDIKPWRTNPPTDFLIFTRRGIDIDRYPSIKRHLERFRAALEPKPVDWPIGKPWNGRKAGPYKWFEIQDNIAYFAEFDEPKIVYQDIARSYGMSWDETGAFLVNTCYFIPAPPKWLLAVLLSPVIVFWIKKMLGHDDGGFLRLFSIHVGEFPITGPSKEQAPDLIRLTTALLWLHDPYTSQISDFPRDPAMREFYERLLNGLVYELYLPEELHEAGLHLFDLVDAAQLPDLDALPAAKSDPKQKLRLLREKFEELADLRHPIRAALQKLSTLDSVRIIEGKA